MVANWPANLHKNKQAFKCYNCHVCKHSSDWIRYDNCVHITQPITKTIPNCDVSFANELHQAYVLLARDIIYISRAYATMSVSVCL